MRDGDETEVDVKVKQGDQDDSGNSGDQSDSGDKSGDGDGDE